MRGLGRSLTGDEVLDLATRRAWIIDIPSRERAERNIRRLFPGISDDNLEALLAGNMRVSGGSFVVTEVDSFKSSTSTQASYTSPTYSPAANDIIIVFAGTNLNQQASSVADSLSNTFTLTDGNVIGTTLALGCYEFKYTSAQTNITVTVNWSPSVSERLVKVLKIGGGGTIPDTTTAGGTSSSAHILGRNAGSASPAPGSMTPTSADLIVAGAAWAVSTAATSGPSGYTNTGTDLNEPTRGRSLSTYYKVQGATGAENPTWSLPSSPAWIAIQVGITVGVTSVQKTLTASYNIKNSISKTATASFTIKQAISKTATASFTIKQAITKALTPAFNIISRTPKSLTASFNIHAYPNLTVPAVISGTPLSGQLLSVSATFANDPVDPVTKSYKWQIETGPGTNVFVDIPGETGSTLQL